MAEQPNDFYTKFLEEHSFAELLEEAKAAKKTDAITELRKIYGYSSRKESKETKNKLERNADGRPILHLTPLEKTAVNAPTREDYNTLMRVYECSGWKWHDGKNPSEINRWEIYGSDFCAGVGVHWGTNKVKVFGWGDKENYISLDGKIISIEEFYKIQKITPEMIKEVNKYFEKRNS